MSDFLKNIMVNKDPYLIAEIGINHNGDMNIAKKLIDATNACGWHCAKFQKRNPDVCVPENQKNIRRDTPWGEMTYIDYKYRVEFEKKEYDLINKYCDDKNLEWTASVWDLDSLEFILNYNIPFIKIPSAHITNHELIKECAKSNIPVLFSTGMSNWEIIDNAVEILEKEKAQYAMFHCNSTYPAPHNELNLNIIPTMIERYNCIVGYSGHEYDLDPSVIAVSLGAKIIERHVTLDHKMWGTDHGSSLEIHAMDLLQKRIKDINIMLGNSEKIITESELPVMEKLRG
jgi:N-acetylneuraminate synthase